MSAEERDGPDVLDTSSLHVLAPEACDAVAAGPPMFSGSFAASQLDLLATAADKVAEGDPVGDLQRDIYNELQGLEREREELQYREDSLYKVGKIVEKFCEIERIQQPIAVDDTGEPWYPVAFVVKHKDTATGRLWLVRWQGYDRSADTWEPRQNITPLALEAYELSKLGKRKREEGESSKAQGSTPKSAK